MMTVPVGGLETIVEIVMIVEDEIAEKEVSQEIRTLTVGATGMIDGIEAETAISGDDEIVEIVMIAMGVGSDHAHARETVTDAEDLGAQTETGIAHVVEPDRPQESGNRPRS